MNAVKIIEEIQQLPDGEREKVVEFVRHLPNKETLEAMEEAKSPEKLDGYNNSSEMFKSLGVKC